MVSSRLFIRVAIPLAWLFVNASLATAHPTDHSSHRKIDSKLRESPRQGHSTERVIITLAPGCRSDVRQALEQHGDRIKSEHRFIDALSAEAHPGDVDQLAAHPCVRSIAAEFLYKNLAASRGRARNGAPVLWLSATSMAAAVTSGVVALILQQHNQNGLHRQKALTPNLVKGMLQFMSIPVTDAGYLTQGGGEINAAGAIALAKVIDTSARANAWWLSAGVTPSSEIGTQTYAWSKRIICGDDVLAGPVLYYNTPAWSVTAEWGGDDIVWGTFASRVADAIVWGTWNGDDIVWGTSAGDNVIWGTIADELVWGTYDDIIWGTAGAF